MAEHHTNLGTVTVSPEEPGGGSVRWSMTFRPHPGLAIMGPEGELIPVGQSEKPEGEGGKSDDRAREEPSPRRD